MTKTKAREILGISKSTGIKTAEKAYLQKQKELWLRICPGNTRAKREKAQLELAELTEAWKTLKTVKPRVKRKPARKPKSPPPSPQSQDLGDIWDLLFDLIPFPNEFVAAVMVLAFIVTLSVLIFNL